MDDSGQPLPCPEEDAVIPRAPVGSGRHKPCLRVTPPRIGAPEREREGPVTSEDEKMNDPAPKRRSSALDTAYQDLGDPAPPQRTSAVDYGGPVRNGEPPSIGHSVPLKQDCATPPAGLPFGNSIVWDGTRCVAA